MYNKKRQKKVAKTFGSFKKLPYLCGVLRKQVKNRQKKNKKKVGKQLQVSKNCCNFASELVKKQNTNLKL